MTISSKIRQRPDFVCQVAHGCQEARLRIERPLERFHDDGCQVVTVLVHQLAGQVEVVELRNQHLLLHLRRDAAAVWNAVGIVAGAGRRGAQGGVVVAAVERPFELQHLVAAGIGPGDAHGVEGGLRAGAHKADLLGARHGSDYLLGKPNCRFVQEKVGGALRYLCLHRRHHRRMGVPNEHGPRPQDAVDVLPAGHVPHVAAAPVGDHYLIFVRQPPQARRPSRKEFSTQRQEFLLRCTCLQTQTSCAFIPHVQEFVGQE